MRSTQDRHALSALRNRHLSPTILGPDPTAPPGRLGGRRRRSREWLRPVLAVLALAVAAYLAFHYTGPSPRRELLHVTRAASTRTIVGESQRTSALDVAITADHRVYGITRTEAASLNHGGWFTCTVTRPIKNRSPDASNCTPAAAPVPTAGSGP